MDYLKYPYGRDAWFGKCKSSPFLANLEYPVVSIDDVCFADLGTCRSWSCEVREAKAASKVLPALVRSRPLTWTTCGGYRKAFNIWY
jgi:hypothetical protein